MDNQARKPQSPDGTAQPQGGAVGAGQAQSPDGAGQALGAGAGQAVGAVFGDGVVGAEDVRRRPVVLHAGRVDDAVPGRSARYLAWAGSGVLGLVAAAGLVAGGSAVWSAFDPGTPGRSPAPLWFPPPETITPQSERITPTPTLDDRGGDHTRTPRSSSTSEPGDDKGGTRPSTGKTTGKSTTSQSTSGRSTTSQSTSGRSTTSQSTSGKGDSGKSGSEDGPKHN
jgi:hypothetical protein